MIAIIAGSALAFTLGAATGSQSADEDGLRQRVEKSLGWTFKKPPVLQNVSAAELQDRVARTVGGERGRRLEGHGRLLQLFGRLPANYSPADGWRRALGFERRAWFDPSDQKIFVDREAAGKAREEALVREWITALQHEHEPLARLLREDDPDADDARAAVANFLEGEAILHFLSVTGAGRSAWEERTRLERALFSEPERARPLFLAGADMASMLSERLRSTALAGSAPGLHRSFPLSTERLWYGAAAGEEDPPVAVFLPDLSKSVGGGRSLSYETVLGARFLNRELFASRIVRDKVPPVILDVNERFMWGGDRLHLYEKPGGADPVAVLVFRWDTSRAAVQAFRMSAWTGLPPPVVRAWEGQDTAMVVGLPPDEGARVAREALGRSIAKPFTFVEALRELRKGLSFPQTPRAPTDPMPLLLSYLESTKFVNMSNFVNDVKDLPGGMKLFYLMTARAARELKGRGFGPVAPDKEANDLPWTPAEIDVLARAGCEPRSNLEFVQKYVDAYDAFGTEWPDRIVELVIQRKAVTSSAPQYAEFLKKYLSRPSFSRAVFGERCRYHMLAPEVKAVYASALEAAPLPPSKALSVPTATTTESARLLRSCIAGLVDGKVKWEEADVRIMADRLPSCSPIDMPAGALRATAGMPAPLRAFVALHALAGPEREEARKALAESFHVLIDPSTPNFFQLLQDPAVFADVLSLARERAKKDDSRRLARFIDMMHSLSFPDGGRAVFESPAWKQLSGADRARLMSKALFDGRTAGSAVAVFRKDLESNAYGEALQELAEVFKNRRQGFGSLHHKELVDALAAGCAAQPGAMRAFHPQVAEWPRIVSDERIMSMIQAVPRKDGELLEPIIRRSAEANPERVAGWAKAIQTLPADRPLRRDLEKLAGSRPVGAGEPSVAQLLEALKEGPDDAAARQLLGSSLSKAQVKEAALLCVAGVEKYPDAYLPPKDAKKVDELPPRLQLLRKAYAEPEVLPGILETWKRVEKTASPKTRDALLLMIRMMSDARAITFLVAHFDEKGTYWAPEAALAILLKPFVPQFPEGDRKSKEYWARLVAPLKEKLPRQLE